MCRVVPQWVTYVCMYEVYKYGAVCIQNGGGKEAKFNLGHASLVVALFHLNA